MVTEDRAQRAADIARALVECATVLKERAKRDPARAEYLTGLAYQFEERAKTVVNQVAKFPPPQGKSV